MDVKQAIARRRSIRKYKDKEVSEELVHELLDAARQAPSGNFAEPWRFKVIMDKETKELLKQNNIYAQAFVYEAPAIIVCCGNPSAFPERKPEANRQDLNNNVRAIRDLSIATGFLVLRAEELGLSTCYIGWQDKDKIKEILNIPKEYECPYSITVGYADEVPHPLKRKEIKDIVL